MEFGNAYLLLVFTVICVVPSSAQNLELVDKIDKLELSVFGTCFNENFGYEFGRPICKLVQQFCIHFGQHNHIFQL